MIFFCRRIFQRKKNALQVFLSGCRNIRESMGELKKVMETVIFLLVFPQHFSLSLIIPLRFLSNNKKMT